MSGTLPGLAACSLRTNSTRATCSSALPRERPPARRSLRRPGRARRALRLRLINVAADTPFSFSVDDDPLTLVASDGEPVTPVKADAVLLGMGERADVLLDADRPGPTACWPRRSARRDTRSRRCATATRPARSHPPRSRDERAPRTPAYADLTDALAGATLAPDRQIRLDLAMDESKTYGCTMGGQRSRGRHHRRRRRRARLLRDPEPHDDGAPDALHGHFLRDVTGRPDGPPKTHRRPAATPVRLDLLADNPGEWMFHCQNLYHQSAGMMRVVAVGHAVGRACTGVGALVPSRDIFRP